MPDAPGSGSPNPGHSNPGHAPAQRASIAIGLSTASVYPEKTEDAFRYAAELGYDGVELMVWAESVSRDPLAIEALSVKYSMPVLSVHAPCLLISQRVWGTDPVAKLDRAVSTAVRLGAQTVVVHPPFRWQRRYARGFSEQVARLEADTGVLVAVENMFPVRADSFLGRRAAKKAAARTEPGTMAGVTLSAFAPTYDPTDTGYDHYTLDLSHTATARDDTLALLDRMGGNLAHLHLADGKGAAYDEHLLPGHGSQPVVEVCQALVASGFAGHAILEINTQTARSAVERRSLLHQALTFARVHLNTDGVPAAD